MTAALILLAAVALANAVYLLAIVAAAKAAGVPVAAVVLGLGPTLVRARIGAFALALRLFPVAGHVRFVEEGTGHRFATASTGVRVALALAGPAAALGLAALLMGVEAAAGEALSSWGEAFRPLLALDLPNEAWAAMLGAAATLPFPALLGAVAAKLGALNLLPLPPLSGGLILIDLAGWRAPWPAPLEGAMKLSLLLLIALGALWVAGAVRLLAASL